MKNHWTKEIALAVRARKQDLKQTLAAIFDGIGPTAPKPEPQGDPVEAFLSLSPQERYALLTRLSPEQYREFSTDMMRRLTQRYGPAAQQLFPLIENVGPAQELQQVRLELPEVLGYDPFGGSLYAP